MVPPAPARAHDPESPDAVASDHDDASFEAAAAVPRAQSSTASSYEVTARDLNAVPHRTAEDALRLVPGVTVVQHGSEGKGYQFFLRGFDAIHGSDLELTLEGIPLNEWSNVHAQGYLDLGLVIPETIQSLDVTKGPFELHQGAFAMAGSADYQLGIAPGERGAVTRYTVGTTGRQRGFASASYNDGDGQDFLALEALHDDGYGENRSIDRFALLGKTRLFDSRSAGTLSLLVAGQGAGFAQPGTLRDDDVSAGRVGFYDSYDPAGHGISARNLLALRHSVRAGPHHIDSSAWGGYRHLELLENYTGFLYDRVNGDRRQQLQGAWSYGAASTIETRLAAPLALVTGAGLRGDVIEQQQQHVGLNTEPLEIERALDATQILVHGLLGLRYRPVHELQIHAGVRLDVAQVSARDELADDERDAGAVVSAAPRVTAEWRPIDSLGLYAAYGRGFRPPEARAFSSYEPPSTGFGDDLHEGGEPSMTFADAVEVGTRFNPSRYLGAQLSGFATFIAKESVFDHVSGVNLELNATRRVGVELDLDSHPLEWLTVSGDVTYVDARFVESQNPVPLAPSLQGGLRTIATHPSGFQGGLRFLALAPRALPHGAYGEALLMLDATLGYHQPHWQLDLELENLLARQLREGQYHYASYWDRSSEPSAIPIEHFAAGPPLNARLSLALLF